MTHELIRVTDPPVFGVPMWICRCGCRFPSDARFAWHQVSAA